MTAVVPHRFLFRWSFPIARLPAPPGDDAPPPVLSEAQQLPALAELDQEASFATWRIAWHEQGLAFDVTVSGKSEPVVCDPFSPASSSGVHVWLDTRATQNVHRATRFCHRFALLPVGIGRKKQQPLASFISLALPGGAAGAATAVRMASELTADGYRVQAWIPAGSLIGYDPQAHARLGFYGAVRDAELGLQPLTVGDEFPYATDPSLWQTLELVR